MVYKEVQGFNQWWLKVLLGAVVILPFVIAISDGEQLSAEDLTGSGIVAIIAYLMLFVLKLETTIDEHGIHYRFFPFHLSTQTRKWNEIECAYVRIYHPLAEFGGWGVRSSFRNGQALNVSGNVGLQIKLRNGKLLLIGTNRRNEIESVMNEFYQRHIVSYRCSEMVE